ncbi:hypothetical protein VNI00_010577 [Paramarasmius palmivorus]|uniref:Cytochrome P450 n=1 Tax=Paramarasmius palmivorus TaxID=297713 RepID=A0AAW0CJ62_9AGAR
MSPLQDLDRFQALWIGGLLIVAYVLIPIVSRHIRNRKILNVIPGPSTSSWWKGHFKEAFGTDGWAFQNLLKDKYGSTATFLSLFGEKILYTYDPKALHHMLVKDMNNFEEQPAFLDTNRLAFGDGLLATVGEHHRKQRKLLNPVFSTAHMRDMVPIFNGVVRQLRSTLAKKVQNGPQEVDMLSWLGRTALELVGQSGLGYSFDTLADEECAHPYSKALKEFMPFVTRQFFLRAFVVPWAIKIGTPKFRRFVVQYLLPFDAIQRGRAISDYMWGLSSEIYEAKKRALERGDEDVVEQVGRGKDILSALINENMKAESEDKLSESELIAQSALSRTLYLLASNPLVQTRLRKELAAALQENDGDLAYDQLMSLPYLEAVCRETLRLHPPLTRLFRTSLQDAVVPLSKPLPNGMTEIHVPAGANIYVSVLNANRNPDIWGEDAMEWKPERWLESLPKSVTEAKMPGVYSHMMTFNAGGRSCIGFKFAQLEMKVVLAQLVSTFEFTLPKDKEIVWQYMEITSPATIVEGKEEKSPKLPLQISLLERM